uniref:Putative ixodes 8-cys protein n=1 Tax=Ixodes ricinus TaxID=34613 RepID=A0A0K8RHC3_IXORI
MFKLKFFILFVLAGLCFGDASNSESGTSPDNQDTNSGGPQGTNSDDSKAPKESNGEETADATKPEMGNGLPDFVGNNTEKVKFMAQLLSQCDHQHDLFKINKENISFVNCTYTCISEGSESTREERIPEGLICDSQKNKCPKSGNCPTAQPLPSC